MSEPYVGEIRSVGFNFAPQGWLACQGQLVSISEYETLFELIGTTFGGDGVSTFGLPDLQGRVPVHAGTFLGTTSVLGQEGGTESVVLNVAEIPSHNHPILASSAIGNTGSPSGAIFAANTKADQYEAATPNTATAAVVASSGSSQAHENRMPFVVVNYIIAWAGVFPSQS